MFRSCAGTVELLLVFEIDLLFSTLRCPAVGLGQWNCYLHLRWSCFFQRLGVPQSGWDSGVVVCI